MKVILVALVAFVVLIAVMYHFKLGIPAPSFEPNVTHSTLDDVIEVEPGVTCYVVSRRTQELRVGSPMMGCVKDR